MVDEERALAAHPEERDIAVVTRETGKERQRIPAGRDERAQQRQPRARGASRPLHACEPSARVFYDNAIAPGYQVTGPPV